MFDAVCGCDGWVFSADSSRYTGRGDGTYTQLPARTHINKHRWQTQPQHRSVVFMCKQQLQLATPTSQASTTNPSQMSPAKTHSDRDSQDQRRVSFALHQTEYFAGRCYAIEMDASESMSEEHAARNSITDQHQIVSKTQLWYSQTDLIPTREESRQTLQALQAANGEWHKVPQHLCVRGIEKFGNLSAKIQGERILKDTILRQQFLPSEPSTTTELGTDSTPSSRSARKRACPEQLATLSRYLSEPSRHQAHQWALVNAQDVLSEALWIAHGFRVTTNNQDTSSSYIKPTISAVPSSQYQEDQSNTTGEQDSSNKTLSATSLLVVSPSSPHRRLVTPVSEVSSPLQDLGRPSKKARCARIIHEAPRLVPPLRTTE